MLLYNTLTNKKGEFEPIHKDQISMYHCGPTVYDYPHIGNMRSYVLADTIRRYFEYVGSKVNQVINITDVGHLVGDGDQGEDKIEKMARQNGKTAEEIANFYEDIFHKNLADLNINTNGTQFPKASRNIVEQIEIIKTLEEKGFTYQTSDGIYFDTSKFHDYGKLGNINIEGLKEGARIGQNSEKKNISDFALWKFSNNSENKRLQEWESPWGVGFPGWHIECSAMSRKFLGQPFDIHTGGIDHIAVHHNNEIAQSECAFDLPLANYWLHNEFILIEGEKMSKSLGNTFTIDDLKNRKIHPLSFRYWLLTGHYKSQINFTWESIFGAQTTLEKIVAEYSNLNDTNPKDKDNLNTIMFNIEDDFNTPKVIAFLHDALNSGSASKKLIDSIDKLLGLDIKNLSEKTSSIPEEIIKTKEERDLARSDKDWNKSDDLRFELEQAGFVVEDRNGSSIIRRSLSSII